MNKKAERGVQAALAEVRAREEEYSKKSRRAGVWIIVALAALILVLFVRQIAPLVLPLGWGIWILWNDKKNYDAWRHDAVREQWKLRAMDIGRNRPSFPKNPDSPNSANAPPEYPMRQRYPPPPYRLQQPTITPQKPPPIVQLPQSRPAELIPVVPRRSGIVSPTGTIHPREGIGRMTENRNPLKDSARRTPFRIWNCGEVWAEVNRSGLGCNLRPAQNE